MTDKKKETIMTLFGILFVAIYLFPFVWMILSSFKEQQEIFSVPPTLLPSNWSWDSYETILQNDIFINLRNSFIIAGSAALLATVLAVPSAYILARFNIKWTWAFLLIFLATQMLPATVVLTPLFIMFSRIGILNTYLAPILATSTLGLPFSVLLLRPFFKSIPKELEEASMMDGSSPIGTFFRIILPISFPSILVSATISFFFAWGDLIYSITFNRSQDLWPMTAGIYNSIGQYGIEWNSLMAFATVTVLPVMILFVLLQKRLVKGLTAGSIK